MILEFAFRAKITFQRSICQNSVDRSENFLEIFIKRCVVQEFLHKFSYSVKSLPSKQMEYKPTISLCSMVLIVAVFISFYFTRQR